jgi:hypothetical protein
VYIGVSVAANSHIAVLDHSSAQLLNRNLPNGTPDLIPVLGRLARAATSDVAMYAADAHARAAPNRRRRHTCSVG